MFKSEIKIAIPETVTFRIFNILNFFYILMRTLVLTGIITHASGKQHKDLENKRIITTNFTNHCNCVNKINTNARRELHGKER